MRRHKPLGRKTFHVSGVTGTDAGRTDADARTHGRRHRERLITYGCQALSEE